MCGIILYSEETIMPYSLMLSNHIRNIKEIDVKYSLRFQIKRYEILNEEKNSVFQRPDRVTTYS